MKTTLPGKQISQALSKPLMSKIASLGVAEVLAVYVRNTSTDDNKVQVEFAEKINLSSSPRSALAFFNPDDERFSQGARRVWMTMDRKLSEEMFGVTIKEGEAFAEIGKTIQPIKSENGKITDFRIRIIEKLESQLTPEQAEYRDNYLKQIPSTGAYFIAKHSGEKVASTTDLVMVPRNEDGTKGDPKHVLIEGEFVVPGSTNILENAGGSVDISKSFVG